MLVTNPCNIEPDEHGARHLPAVCGWTTSQHVPVTGKALVDDIRSEVTILGRKHKGSGITVSLGKYEHPTIKDYLSGIYQDAHNVFLVQPKMGRRFESLRLCLWDPAIVNTQQRMSFPWFKIIARLQTIVDDQIKELISKVKVLSVPYRESLANTLITLFNDAKEEDSSSLGISLGSLGSYYNFLQSNLDLKCPAVTLSPDNNIYISWRGESKRIFSVHFLQDGNARFVLFKPNDKHPEQQIRISGTIAADTLIDEVAKPQGVYDWIRDEG